MAKLTLHLDGEQRKFVTDGAGDIENAEIISVNLPDAHPQYTTITLRLMTLAECAASEKLRQAATARRVSTNLGTAECQRILAASGFDQKKAANSAENILKKQAAKK